MAYAEMRAMFRRSMPSTEVGRLNRLWRLGRVRRRLLWDAALTVTLASAVVALLPFSRAIRFGCVKSRGQRAEISPADLVWAVEAAAKRVPCRTVCIEKGLAFQRLLRRRGMQADLHYGARHNPETGKLEAHVWVSIDGEILMGADQAGNFAELASYPGSATTS